MCTIVNRIINLHSLCEIYLRNKSLKYIITNKTITCNLIHILRSDYLDRFVFLGNQQLMHLVRQYRVSYKFSNTHLSLYEPDGITPTKKKQMIKMKKERILTIIIAINL